jgi:hypothetical protein
MNKREIDVKIETIDIGNVEYYLNKLGWKIETNKNKKALLLISPETTETESVKLLLPSDKKYIDFERSMNDMVSVLAEIYQKPMQTIINEMMDLSIDVFKASIAKNQIGLSDAYQSIKALRKMILFSASSITNPQKSYKQHTGRSDDVLEKFTFGHTFKGSFGFVVSTDISYSLDQLSLLKNEQIPDQRLVLERIAIGLDDVASAVRKNDVRIIVDNYMKGLNSRICESLLEFACDGRVDTSFSMLWGKNIPVHNNVNESGIWTLGKQHYEVINEAARLLKEIDPIDTTLVGRVVTLHTLSSYESRDEFKGTIHMKSEILDKSEDVKISLSKFNYYKALEAHRGGQNIEVTGTLAKVGNSWSMDVHTLNITNN